jgi:hypothetical protein
MTAPIDSIPRVSVRDLFIALRQFETEDTVTLENLRLKFCYDRNARRKGSPGESCRYWSRNRGVNKWAGPRQGGARRGP